MFVLEAPVLSFNPKALFCDELFRQCFPKLSLISTDPEREQCAAPSGPGLQGVSIFWLREVPKERIPSQRVSFSGQQGRQVPHSGLLMFGLD